MRRRADAARVRAFMRALGRRATMAANVYLAGGASAVLVGWRETTRDLDLRIEPDAAFGPLADVVAALKTELELNLEFASPSDFLPDLPGWRDRSPFIQQDGHLVFRHYDFYGQALAKVLRDVENDATDVRAMLGRSLVDPDRAWQLYGSIRPLLGRFPAIDEPSFRRRMVTAFGASSVPPATA